MPSPNMLFSPQRFSLATLTGLLLAASAAAQVPQYDTLTTTFASNNGLDGNMFDIKALNEVRIAALDGHFNAGSVTIEVYTVAGGYTGYETDSAAWTLVGSGTTTSAGPDLPTPIPFPLDVLIPAGQTVGFYVTCTGSPGIKYTDGTGLVYSNADMELYEGRGVDYPFGTSYSPRTWNGTVYYNGEVGDAYCYGDGSGSFCPCGNPGATETGCANSSGVGAAILGSGSTSLSADDLVFAASGLLPGQPALLFAGTTAVNGGLGNLLGDGLRCAGMGVVRLGIQTPNATGEAVFGPGLAGPAGFSVGEVRNFQVWYRDPVNSPCGSGFNLSHGVQLTFGS